MNLSGKVVAVTGGFGQLGVAVVQAALAAGAKVAALDVAPSPADPKALGGALVLGGLDLAEPATVARALDAVAGKLGGLDGLVNVAGTFRWQTLEEGNVETWDLLYRVNLRTAVAASRAEAFAAVLAVVARLRTRPRRTRPYENARVARTGRSRSGEPRSTRPSWPHGSRRGTTCSS